MTDGVIRAMIGNDVVDLTDAEARPGAQHPRFDARVLAPSERPWLACDPSPRRRWSLWAAKEAAFKAARKLDPRAVWAPSRFVVDLEAAVPFVRWGERVFALWLSCDGDRVHACATIHVPAGRHGGATPAHALGGSRGGATMPHALGESRGGATMPHALPRVSGGGTGRGRITRTFVQARVFSLADAGVAARRLAGHAIAAALGLRAGDVAIVTRDRVPFALHRGAPLPLDLSLAHHGRFAACAFALEAA